MDRDTKKEMIADALTNTSLTPSEIEYFSTTLTQLNAYEIETIAFGLTYICTTLRK